MTLSAHSNNTLFLLFKLGQQNKQTTKQVFFFQEDLFL